MILISLRKLIEESLAVPGIKFGSGNIQDIQKLFTAENLAALDASYSGLYAFLIFHPTLDPAVLTYINAGGLDAQTGDQIMALFCSSVQSERVQQSVNPLFDGIINISHDSFFVYEIVRSLFPNDARLFFPGVLIFERFSRLSDAVYVSIPPKALKELSEVSSQINRIFRIAEECIETDLNRPFIDKYAAAMAQHNFTYLSRKSISPEEIIYKIFHKVIEFKGDIISIACKLL